MKAFLDTHWLDLLVVSYRVKAGYEGLLKRYLPAGTELDDFHGEHYVSVVGFRFCKTKILGIPMPFYREFAEMNLRFYVKREVGGEWRRGVVFVKEIIRPRLPALVANLVFCENFHRRHLDFEKEGKVVRYLWDECGYKQKIEGVRDGKDRLPGEDTLERHIIEHFWAYKRKGEGKTLEFGVTRRPWMVQGCGEADIKLDVGRVYGEEWGRALGDRPVSVFYAEGSRVGVTRPRNIFRRCGQVASQRDRR